MLPPRPAPRSPSRALSSAARVAWIPCSRRLHSYPRGSRRDRLRDRAGEEGLAASRCRSVASGLASARCRRKVGTRRDGLQPGRSSVSSARLDCRAMRWTRLRSSWTGTPNSANATSSPRCWISSARLFCASWIIGRKRAISHPARAAAELRKHRRPGADRRLQHLAHSHDGVRPWAQGDRPEPARPD